MLFGRRDENHRSKRWARAAGRKSAVTCRRPAVEALEERTLPAGLPVNAVMLAPEHLDNQILVRFAPGVDASGVVGAIQAGASLGDKLLNNLYVVQLENGTNVADALTAYQASALVVYAEPDYVFRADVIPNDPLFGSLWGLNNTGQSSGTADADIDAPEAWDVQSGATGVIVAVIDTGVKYDHVDLAGNIWTNTGEIAGNGFDDDGNGFIDDVVGWDFANNDADPMDDHGHGTHCAGTIGAVGDNGVGVTGVVWDVQIMSLKFMTAAGSGSLSNAIKSINYAHANGAKITSNSWGGGGFTQSLYDAIKAGRDTYDAVFVAAAGNAANDNDAKPSYPATYDLDNIVSVAATDRNDVLAGFSNYGATTVDLAAPGVSILSTWNNGGYNTISGTSMATPHVAGAVALIRSAFGSDKYLAVIQRLLGNVQVLPGLAGKVLTGGRLLLEGLVTPPPSGNGSVGDLVWRDFDLDGRQDAGEPGVTGIVVHLFDAQDQPVATTMTANGGLYSFTNIPAGSYYLKFDAPFGITFSPKDQGDDIGDSDVTKTTSKTDLFLIQPNVNLTTVDAGLIPVPSGGGGWGRVIIIPPLFSGSGSGSTASAPSAPPAQGGGTGRFLGGKASSSAATGVSAPTGKAPTARLDARRGDPTDALFAGLGLTIDSRL